MRFNALLLATALSLAGTAAHAASYTFSGLIDAGPLSGTSFSGSYDVDTSTLSNVGFESLALSSFSLNFSGQTYAWNASATADFDSGSFLGLSYQTSAPGYSLTLTSGSIDSSDAYLHYQPTGGLESSGGYTVSAVPEPQSLALLLAGLLTVGALARRRS